MNNDKQFRFVIGQIGRGYLLYCIEKELISPRSVAMTHNSQSLWANLRASLRYESVAILAKIFEKSTRPVTIHSLVTTDHFDNHKELIDRLCMIRNKNLFHNDPEVLDHDEFWKRLGLSYGEVENLYMSAIEGLGSSCKEVGYAHTEPYTVSGVHDRAKKIVNNFIQRGYD